MFNPNTPSKPNSPRTTQRPTQPQTQPQSQSDEQVYEGQGKLSSTPFPRAKPYGRKTRAPSPATLAAYILNQNRAAEAKEKEKAKAETTEWDDLTCGKSDAFVHGTGIVEQTDTEQVQLKNEDDEPQSESETDEYEIDPVLAAKVRIAIEDGEAALAAPIPALDDEIDPVLAEKVRIAIEEGKAALAAPIPTLDDDLLEFVEREDGTFDLSGGALAAMDTFDHLCWEMDFIEEEMNSFGL